MLANFNSPYELGLVEDFVKRQKSNLGLAEGAFKEAIEKIHINIGWMNKNFVSISAWLKNVNA